MAISTALPVVLPVAEAEFTKCQENCMHSLHDRLKQTSAYNPDDQQDLAELGSLHISPTSH